ncbi:hypothetical protein [Paraburkholderia graminis]|uniref:hypothetical protein n=1 Tax=Paraburkholderia graminis TaxID=60548 RepID=UPI0038BB3AD2
MLSDKIYHRLNPEVDLRAADFSHKFIVRKFAGHCIDLYATLRVTGHDAPSSFIAAFGKVFYGHPEAVASAAGHFERTITFQLSVEEATERLGEERIAKELSARCEEISAFTAVAARAFRIEFSERFIDRIRMHQDDKAFAEFAAERRKEREKATAKDRVGNGLGEGHE